MSIARRSFLKSATMSTLSAGLAFGSAHLIFGQEPGKGVERAGTKPAPSDDFKIPRKALREGLTYFKSSTFRPYVGDIFQASNSRGQTIELTLTKVAEYKPNTATRITTKRARGSESFSLTFSTNEQLPPFSSIHQMSHPALGTFDLFLTTHQTENGTFKYEAVFSRLE
jgi:hypothetical protein